MSSGLSRPRQDRLIFQQDSNKLIFVDVDEVFSCKKLNNALFNTINLCGSVNSKCINIQACVQQSFNANIFGTTP